MSPTIDAPFNNGQALRHFQSRARGEKTQRVRNFLEAKAGHSVILAPTQQAGDARLLAAEAVKEGFRIIVAAAATGRSTRSSMV